jgi:hypothetical protein
MPLSLSHSHTHFVSVTLSDTSKDLDCLKSELGNLDCSNLAFHSNLPVSKMLVALFINLKLLRFFPAVNKQTEKKQNFIHKPHKNCKAQKFYLRTYQTILSYIIQACVSLDANPGSVQEREILNNHATSP